MAEAMGKISQCQFKKKKCSIYILGIGPDPYKNKAFGWKSLSSVMGQVPSQCHCAALSALKAALQAHFTWRMPTLTPAQAHQQKPTVLQTRKGEKPGAAVLGGELAVPARGLC